MRTAIAAWGLLCLGASVVDAQLTPSYRLLGTTTDYFGRGDFDVYQVAIRNDAAVDVTTLEVSITGEDFVQEATAFRTEDSLNGSFGALPEFVPGIDILDSFFVTPGDSPALIGGFVATDSELSGSWTVAGTEALVPAGGCAVIATITVPTGTPFDIPSFQSIGNGVADGQRTAIVRYEFLDNEPCVPEPSSAAWLSLILIGFGTVRRRG